MENHLISMNFESYLDWAIVGILLLSIVVSIFRGFIREAVSLMIWVLAIGLGLYFMEDFAALFPEFSSKPIREFIGLFLIFITVMVIGSGVNFLLVKFFNQVGFGWFDRILGATFGAIRGGLVIVLLVIFGMSTPMRQRTWWKDSGLVPGFELLAERVKPVLPKDVLLSFQKMDIVSKRD